MKRAHSTENVVKNVFVKTGRSVYCVDIGHGLNILTKDLILLALP